MAMSDSVAGLVLAAGEGTRLRPLTLERPKPLCPVGGVALLDRAIAGLRAVTSAVAVNTFAGADQVEAHLAAALLGGPVHLSRESRLLGTGGAVGQLRPWIDGRPLVMVNADTVHGGSLAALVDGWDGRKIRFLVNDAPGVGFHARLRLLAVAMPPAAVAKLSPEPGSIYRQVWVPWARRRKVEIVTAEVAWFDCGTPKTYLAAHQWLTGQSVCVWPGAQERVRGWMTDAIVTPRRTVLVR
jgi:MurNAc alpha-1-phosphate uridylyltransferase